MKGIIRNSIRKCKINQPSKKSENNQQTKKNKINQPRKAKPKKISQNTIKHMIFF
jgi:hypothetical protein